MKLRYSLLAFAACGVSAHAVPLTWDTDPLAAGAQGGAGTWANGTTNWWNGAANTAWNNATPDSATFGGTPGAVTVDAAGITTAGMIFDAAGYTVAGGAIALGSGFTLTANADVTINSVLASATNGLTKSGAGTVTVNGLNTYRGATVVNAGTLVIAPGAKVYSGFNGNIPGFLTVNAGGTVEFSNPVYNNSFG